MQASSTVFVSLQWPDGMHHRWATIGEAERLRERGDVRRLRLPGRKCVGKAKPVYRLVPRPEPSESQPTPGPITFEEMEANVGCARDPKIVQAARRKIRNYRSVREHDPSFAGGLTR